MIKKIYLFNNDHTPEKPAFPVIDAHNRLWGNDMAEKAVQTLNSVGIMSLCDVTGNARNEFAEGGYVIEKGEIHDFHNGFFEPTIGENEHYETLIRYPNWSFADPKYPYMLELIERRDNLIRQHPGTIFILPHFANFLENISYVSWLLDNNKNVYTDFSVRFDELGHQPYSSREFFIKHQDRRIFGSDVSAHIETSVKMYQTYFRYQEAYEEVFYASDYDGTYDRARWPICGTGLPSGVLRKIYYKNILKLFPSLKSEIKILNDD